MKTDFFIQKLKEQKLKVNQSDPEVWLQTTYAFIEEYFKIGSTRASSFFSLITEFRVNKSFGAGSAGTDSILRRATEFIDEIIQYLEDLEDHKQNNPLAIDLNGPRVFPATPPDPKKTQLPFGIAPALFWAIFAGIIGGAYLLGQNIGSSRFDKEKIDFYDQIKSLRSDTIQFRHLITSKDSIIKIKESTITSKTDSLRHADKTMLGLSLLIDDLSKKKAK